MDPRVHPLFVSGTKEIDELTFPYPVKESADFYRGESLRDGRPVRRQAIKSAGDRGEILGAEKIPEEDNVPHRPAREIHADFHAPRPLETSFLPDIALSAVSPGPGAGRIPIPCQRDDGRPEIVGCGKRRKAVFPAHFLAQHRQEILHPRIRPEVRTNIRYAARDGREPLRTILFLADPQNLRQDGQFGIEEQRPVMQQALSVHVLRIPGEFPSFDREVVPVRPLGGDAEAMVASLTRLAALPEAIRVLPGHGRPTTLAAERPWLELVARERRLPL